MIRRPGTGKAPRSAFGIGVLIAVAIIAYMMLGGGDTEADYQEAIERFGEDRIERLVLGTLPVGMAKTCHDRHGENEALVDAVAAYNARNQAAMATLVAELESVAAMSNDEKRAVEAAVLRRAEAELPDAAACAAAADRIAAGAFDLAPPGLDAGDAQSEGN